MLTRRVRTGGLLAAGLGLTAVLGWAADAAGHRPLPVVTFTADEHGFRGPETVPAGLTTIRLANRGTRLHHVQLVRLEQGKTVEDLVRAMSGKEAMPSWATPEGGPNAAEPGDTVSAIQTLVPGSYAMLCLIPGTDGRPHFLDGMSRALQVTGHASRSAEPAADATVTLADYAFRPGATLAPGHRTIRVENAGPQVHELVLVRLEPGRSVQDLLDWAGGGFRTAPPAHFIGGIVGLAPGGHALFTADLEAGDYAYLCFLPDAHDGQPHVAHGMMLQFHVGGAA
jgi:hypothetical protein